MAKMIIIKESEFDAIFEAALDRLKIQRFVPSLSVDETAKFQNSPAGDMHSRFHMEVCILKERLKSS